MKYKDNIGIGIANGAWVLGVCGVIIFRQDASLWLLAIPIIFNWQFVRQDK